MIDLARYRDRLPGMCGGSYRGRIRRAAGILLEAEGLPGAIGDLMRISRTDARGEIEAEVVGLRDDILLLLPLGTLDGIGSGAAVRPAGRGATVRVGQQMLGRVLDALGRPIDGAGPVPGQKEISIYSESPAAMERPAIERVLPTGVRAIDSLLTLGRGQRVGIFSGSGVGKSTLIAQVARGCAADVVVIGLIGERNREVKGFIEDALGPEGLRRAVVVVSTSDRPPLERYRGAFVTVAIAEYFRDLGKDVLLVMDSITRFAGACREIGLATGEASTVRGFPPSFFATVPKLVERLGRTTLGSITGLLTVLIDADSMEDPVGDTLRGLLDGHVMLSRELTRIGRWPAIDPLESLSRLMRVITPGEQQEQAERLRRWLAELETNRDLLQIGAYKSGTNPDLDEALRRRELIEAFLRQRPEEFNTFEQTQALLAEVTPMKRFRFELERVLRIRRAEEQQAMSHLATVLEHERKVEAALGQTHEEIGELGGCVRAARRARPLPLEELGLLERELERLRERRRFLRAERTRARTAVDAARAVLLERHRDRRVLERLRERRAEEYRHDYLSRKERAAEELARSTGDMNP